MPELISEPKPVPEPTKPADCRCHADVNQCQCHEDEADAFGTAPVLASSPRIVFAPPEVQETRHVMPVTARVLLLLLLVGAATFIVVGLMPVALIFLAFFLPALLPVIVLALGIVATEEAELRRGH
jgi:hypothetical protein